jgi:hypothetical protein
MSVLYDYGEFLICILPPFLIIAAIGLLLLANSWPLKSGNDDRMSGTTTDDDK